MGGYETEGKRICEGEKNSDKVVQPSPTHPSVTTAEKRKTVCVNLFASRTLTSQMRRSHIVLGLIQTHC